MLRYAIKTSEKLFEEKKKGEKGPYCLRDIGSAYTKGMMGNHQSAAELQPLHQAGGMVPVQLTSD